MKIKTKDLVATALLTTIAIIIPLLVPIKVVIPPFSATLASHVPLMLAMFINPAAALFVALGSALGFLFALGPIVAARAAMHVFFVVAGSYMLKRRCNIFFVAFVTLLLHTLSDMFIVYVLFEAFGQTAILKENTMQYAQYVIAAGTSLHHIMDFLIAMVIYIPLSRQNSEMFFPVSYKK